MINENDKSGVIFLARVPPFMTPPILRNLLEKFGEIGNIFLQLEGKKKSKERKRIKKQKHKSFVCGWIEFKDAEVAKKVTMRLHNTKIGGNIKTPFREDLWNLKFLEGFKWHHLNERNQYEQDIKQVKMREATREAEEENNFYARKVSQFNFAKHQEEKDEEKKVTFVEKKFKQKIPVSDDEATTWSPDKKFKELIRLLTGKAE